MMKRIMGWLVLGALCWAGIGQAGEQTGNQFFYKPSLGARGAEEKSRFDAGLEAVDAHLGRYKTLGDPNYSTLSEALTTIGAGQVNLHIPAGTVTVSANTTIPANVHLVVQRGALFSVANGVTLTLNGSLEAGPYQIFLHNGTGKVVFGANSPAAHRVDPAWWYPGTGHWDGALANAMAAVKNVGCGKLVLSRNITLGTGYTHDYGYASFDGGGFLIDASAITSGFAIKITNTDPEVWSADYMSEKFVGNFELKGNSKTGSVAGIYTEGGDGNATCGNLTLRNINIWNFGAGLKLYSHTWDLDGYKVRIHRCNYGVQVPSGGTNYLARASFHGGIIASCNMAVELAVNDSTVDFHGSSFDVCKRLVNISGGSRVGFYGCWIEGVGYEETTPAEMLKIDGNGGAVVMQGGHFIPYPNAGNHNYVVNVVNPQNTMVIRDTLIYGVSPASGYWATGSGFLDLQHLASLPNNDSIGVRFADPTKNDLADGGFEAATLADDWFIREGGTYSSRFSYSNCIISTSTDYARSGSRSLKVQKVGSGSAHVAVLIPVKRMNAQAGWNLWYRKPGNGTGTMYLRAYWVRLAGMDANGVPIWGKEHFVFNQQVNFTSAAVNWTQSDIGARNLSANDRAPSWATHFAVCLDLNGVSGGQSYYFDDLLVSVN